MKTRAGDRLGLEMSMKPNGIMNFAVLIDFVPRGIAGPLLEKNKNKIKIECFGAYF